MEFMKDSKFIDLISAQLDKLEKKLNNNFYQQVIIITIGLGSVIGKESILSSIVTKIGLPADGTSLKVIVTILLFGLFFRFGYLLTNFIAIRHTMGKLISPYLKEYSNLSYTDDDDDRMVSYAVRPLSYFEIFIEKDYLKKFRFSVFLFYGIIFCVLCLNHLLFVYLIQDFTQQLIALKYSIIPIYILINVYLYLEFIKSNVNERLTKSFRTFGIIMSIIMTVYLIITELII